MPELRQPEPNYGVAYISVGQERFTVADDAVVTYYPGNAMEAILVERRRQIRVEGFTTARDLVKYPRGGELLQAARCYYEFGLDPALPRTRRWPWDKKWWKPVTRLRALVKAGALCLAEIDLCIARKDWQNIALCVRLLRSIEASITELRQ